MFGDKNFVNNLSLVFITVVVVVLIVRGIMVIYKRVRTKNYVSSVLYKGKMEGLIGKILKGATTVFIVYMYYRSLSLSYGKGENVGLFTLLKALEKQEKIVLIIILILQVVIIISMVISIIFKGILYKEGISFSSGEFIPWSEVTGVEYKKNMLDTYYEVRVYKDKKSDVFHVSLDDIERVLNIIRENTPAEMLKIDLVTR